MRCSVFSNRWRFLYAQILEPTLSPFLLLGIVDSDPNPVSLATVERIISNLLMLHSQYLEGRRDFHRRETVMGIIESQMLDIPHSYVPHPLPYDFTSKLPLSHALVSLLSPSPTTFSPIFHPISLDSTISLLALSKAWNSQTTLYPALSLTVRCFRNLHAEEYEFQTR